MVLAESGVMAKVDTMAVFGVMKTQNVVVKPRAWKVEGTARVGTWESMCGMRNCALAACDY